MRDKLKLRSMFTETWVPPETAERTQGNRKGELQVKTEKEENRYVHTSCLEIYFRMVFAKLTCMEKMTSTNCNMTCVSTQYGTQLTAVTSIRSVEASLLEICIKDFNNSTTL